MIHIEKIKTKLKGKVFCVFCEEVATKTINDYHFCARCGDGELVKIIGKCIKSMEQATVTIKVMPKRGN